MTGVLAARSSLVKLFNTTSMDYPPHQSYNIVSSYFPLIKQALAAFPEVSQFEPDGVALSTFCARFRDSIKALKTYGYDGLTLNDEESQKLSNLKTRVIGGTLYAGERLALKAIDQTVSVGQMTRTEAVGLVHTVNEPTRELLLAIGVCLKHGIFMSINIAGLSEELVRNVLPDVTITKTGKELILYV